MRMVPRRPADYGGLMASSTFALRRLNRREARKVGAAGLGAQRRAVECHPVLPEEAGQVRARAVRAAPRRLVGEDVVVSELDRRLWRRRLSMCSEATPGVYFRECVFSEVALSDRQAWPSAQPLDQSRVESHAQHHRTNVCPVELVGVLDQLAQAAEDLRDKVAEQRSPGA